MSSEREHIVDTVVLLYFLLAGQQDLLLDLLGEPLQVPRIVHDPEDRALSEDALRRRELLSEMRQAIRYYEVAARSGASDASLATRIQQVDRLHDNGRLDVIDMTDEELRLAARLQSRGELKSFGLRVPLGPGEAACAAIAWHRSWTIVTDDGAALTVLDKLHGGRVYAYERIRKLLIRAAGERRVTKVQANKLHQQMRDLGFWDTTPPFS